MAFYGFNYQKKNRGDTARSVGAIGAQAAVAIPEAKRKDDERAYIQKQREDAAKAILADTELASTNWKTWKETYANQAKGVLPEDQIQSNLKMIAMPRQTDLLDVGSVKDYLNRFSSNTATLFKELNAKRAELAEKKEQEAIGEEVQGVIKGSPAETALPQPIKGPDGKTQFTETDIGPDGKPVVTKPAIPGTTSKEETAKAIGSNITTSQAEQVPAYKEQQSQADIDKAASAQAKWSEEMKLKRAKLNQAQKAAKDRGDNQFFKESEALFTDAREYETIVTKTESIMSEKETEVQELDNERQQIMQKLDASPDQGGYVMPEETQEAEKRLEEIRKAKLAANKEAVSLREKLLNQKKKKMIADEAFDKYIATGGRIGFSGALSTGQQKSKTLDNSGSPKATGIPTKTPQPSSGTDGWKEVGKYKIRQK